jgi:hypothetical protein
MTTGYTLHFLANLVERSPFPVGAKENGFSGAQSEGAKSYMQDRWFQLV